jgi:SAM domain (Sterile alpha motif)
MQEIADWLKKLGMAEYAQRFVENRVDLSVLPDLTDQDLEKLGVLLGDRRKMLRAIRDLGTISAAVTASPMPVPPEGRRTSRASAGQYGPGQHCEHGRSRAASRRCGRPV